MAEQTTNQIRLAVIGVGDMGWAHVRGFLQLPACRVVATVDPNPEWEQDRPLEWPDGRCPHFTSAAEMLAAIRPDACVVAVPDNLHRSVAEQVCAAGCDLLLEKPISNTLADCDAIIKQYEQANRILQIGLVYRYSNFYRRMAELAQQPGWDARLMWCKELRQCFPQKPWFYSQQACGGTLVEKDCHHFDIFNWVIGSEPVRVFATGGQHVWKSGSLIDCDYCPDPPRRIEHIDTVDHALVTIDYANGARASLILCMYLQPNNVMPEGLEIGAISATGRQMAAYQDQRLMTGGLGEPWHAERIDMWSDSCNLGHIGCQQQRWEFLDCVRTRQRPMADGGVGRSALLIALAAERSIQTGQPVDISKGQL
jgi:predicted dehydrogenase